MKELSKFFPKVIKEEGLDAFDSEVDQYHLLEDVPDWKDGTTRLDHWWNEVLKKHNFLHLGKMVNKACLSIFTGPRVEQSFNLMNNTITSTTNRLLVSTFDALQTVKNGAACIKTDIYSKVFQKKFPEISN